MHTMEHAASIGTSAFRNDSPSSLSILYLQQGAGEFRDMGEDASTNGVTERMNEVVRPASCKTPAIWKLCCETSPFDDLKNL